MSELSKNQLLTRRLFFGRAADALKTAGVAATLAGLPRQTKAAAKNPWAYDDSAFRQTDPKLIHYKEVRRFNCPRSTPRRIALSKGNRLFISAGRFITKHDLDGTQLSEIALAAEPRCLALTDDELIYAGFRDHIEMFDAKGNRRTVWDPPSGRPYFTGIAINENDVFVADAGNRLVLRFDHSGKLKNHIGAKSKEKNVSGFIIPSPFFDVELAHDGLLRVANTGRHQVEAYTADGDFEFAWGKAGAAIQNFCGCCNPINLALLADGRTVTFEKGIPRVKIYGTDGSFESVVAGAESFPENAKVCGPNDCTLGGLDGVVDAKGKIYILDFVAANVRVMERNPQPA